MNLKAVKVSVCLIRRVLSGLPNGFIHLFVAFSTVYFVFSSSKNMFLLNMMRWLVFAPHMTHQFSLMLEMIIAYVHTVYNKKATYL